MEQNKVTEANEVKEEKQEKVVEKSAFPTTEHLAMEILKQESEKSKAKNVGVVSLTVAVIVIAIGMAVINYRNDCDWRALFSDYDFISQDGGGENYYNSDVSGEVNNGTTGEK